MKKLCLLLILILFISCGQESTITPLFPVRTVSEQQGRLDGLSLFKASYIMKSDVESPTQFNIPFLGGILTPIFNSFTNGLGNLILSMQTSRDVNFDAIEVEVPDGIDYELLRDLRLKTIKLDVRSDIFDEANFGFIEKIQIYVPNEEKKDASRNDLDQGDAILLAEYDSAEKDFYCQTKKCIQFKIMDVNFIKLVQGKKKIFVKPFMVVNKVPKKTFKFDGSIEAEVKLKLPF